VSCEPPTQKPINPTRSRSLLNVVSQSLHLVQMLLPILRDNPKRTIPLIRAYGKAVTSERELCTNILARPEEAPTLGEHNAGQALDGTTKRLKSENRDSEANAFVIFVCDHTRDA
jgi:hypothetical protein